MSNTGFLYVWEVGDTFENNVFECCRPSTRKMCVFTKLFVHFQEVEGLTPKPSIDP